MAEHKCSLATLPGKLAAWNKKLSGRVIGTRTEKGGSASLRNKALSKGKDNRALLCISQGILGYGKMPVLIAIALSLLMLSPLVMAIPEVFTVQGRLTDSSGDALNGNYTFEFIVYDSNESGKQLLWSETRELAVSDGIFNAVLGDANTQKYLNLLDFNGNMWLGIVVEGEAQQPLTKLTSISSSFVAKKAMSVDLNAFQYFTDFNSWYASLFSPSFLGDSNFVNVGVSSGTYLERLNAAGDSNFTSIEADDAYLTNLTVSGDFNAAKIQVSGVSFADGGIYAEGDINTTGDVNGMLIEGQKFKSLDANSAYGTNAVALGKGTTAFGAYSTALDYNTTASGQYSTAMGSSTTASGQGSTAMGYNTGTTMTASGIGSTAIGYNNTGGTSATMTSSGQGSTAMGYNIAGTMTSSGNGSAAIGYNNIGTMTASGSGSIAMGANSGSTATMTASRYGSIAMGYAVNDHDLLSGGAGSVSMGYGAKSFGTGSISLGYDTNANAKYATAIGYKIFNTNPKSVALGPDVNIANDLNVMGNATIYGDLNVVGDINVNKIGISGITFADGGVTAAGDSNFANIGMTGGFSGLDAIGDSNLANVGVSGTQYNEGNLYCAGGLTALKLDLQIEGAADPLDITSAVDGAEGYPISFMKQRGTLASPEDVIVGDYLGKISWWGWNGDFKEVGWIAGQVGGDFVEAAGKYPFHLEIAGYNEIGGTMVGFHMLPDNNVGIGVEDPSAMLEVFKPDTQLKLSYDASNYATFKAESDGDLTVASNKTGFDADFGDANISTTNTVFSPTIKAASIQPIDANTVSVYNPTSLGAQKITNPNPDSADDWTLGTGWSFGDIGIGTFYHSSGTATLSQASASMVTPIVAGERYTFSVVAGTDYGYESVGMSVSCGGVSLGSTTEDGTFSATFRAVSTADLIIVPVTDAVFRLFNFSLKKVGGNLDVADTVIADDVNAINLYCSADSNFSNLQADDAYLTNLTVTGDFNAGSIQVSGVSFADGGIQATGDSNFANIGMTGGFSGLDAIGDSNFANLEADDAYVGNLTCSADGNIDYLMAEDTNITSLFVSGASRFDTGFDLNPVIYPSSPAIALVEEAGNVDAGKHYYFVTYYTALGETALRSSTPTNVTTDAEHGKVEITLPTSSDYRVEGRKIYRTTADSSYWANVKLVDTVANNTETTYTDNIADASMTGTNYYWQDDSTCKYITVNDTQAALLTNKNTILGYNAGATIAAGTAQSASNVLIGQYAGDALTTGALIVAIGPDALTSNTSGQDNVGIGAYALRQNTSGTGNIGIGRYAGYYNSTSSHNVQVGYYAGFGASGNSHAYDTFVGSLAGQVITTGASNSAFGYKAGNKLTSGSSNIFLGGEAGYNQTTASNLLIIDNQDRDDTAEEATNAILYGVMADAVANQSLAVNADLNAAGAITVGSNLNNNLSAGDINAGTIYSDALTPKSPIFFKTDKPEPICMMADNGTYVGCLPEFDSATGNYDFVCKPRPECDAKIQQLDEKDRLWKQRKEAAQAEEALHTLQQTVEDEELPLPPIPEEQDSAGQQESDAAGQDLDIGQGDVDVTDFWQPDANAADLNQPDQDIAVQPCDIACANDADCDDSNTLTIDICNNDGECKSYCLHLPMVAGQGGGDENR